MKLVMKFWLWGNVVSVYYRESTDTYLIYQIVGRKKFFIDEEDGIDPATQTAQRFCYENACS